MLVLHEATAISMPTIHPENVYHHLSEYRRAHGIKRTGDVRQQPWLVLLLGRREDEELDDWAVESSPSQSAIENRWILPKNGREALAADRVLVKRVDKESYFEVVADI